MSIEPIENEPHPRLVPVHGRETRGVDRVVGTAQAAGAAQAKRSDTLATALGVAVGVSLAAVIVAPVTLSATHLIKWASSDTGLGLPGALAWLVFIALDLAAVACIGMVVLCAKRGESAGAFDLATWAFAFASAFANYTGSTGAGQWFFPAMSIAGPTLLHMVLAKVKRWARIAEGTQLSARPKFGVRWIPGIAFRETARAWAAARRENIGKAADAIAFVREVDVLAEMTDDDTVRYAKAAARTSDPHELRQWLTSRGKNVTQTALPSIALPVDRALDDIAREGAPMAEMFAPMPEKLRAPREALGLPAAPELVTEKPKPRPRPAKRASSSPAVTVRRPRKQDHPRWADAESAYRQSIEKGAKFSQRKLAETLDIHRTLAKAVIDHVDDELFPEEG